MWPFKSRKLGYALGSGSARGLAHIGVLKALVAEGLAPDIISGTSMGAVVGALYAAGRSPEEIEQIALGFDIKSLASLADVTMRGGALLSGEKVEAFLGEHLPETFEELELPFACVSTDLSRGERVVHSSGDLVRSLRSSLSVPLVFLPVRDGDRTLVDGFLSDPVPVSLARDLGADIVVAVDVCGAGRLFEGEIESAGGPLKDLRAALRGEGPRRRGASGLEIAAATVEVLERHVAMPALEDADVVISPEVHEFAGYEFLSVQRLVELGEQAGVAAVEIVRLRARR